MKLRCWEEAGMSYMRGRVQGLIPKATESKEAMNLIYVKERERKG
jgi:hypothetical protein